MTETRPELTLRPGNSVEVSCIGEQKPITGTFTFAPKVESVTKAGVQIKHAALGCKWLYCYGRCRPLYPHFLNKKIEAQKE